jgi:hypothetical protein
VRRCAFKIVSDYEDNLECMASRSVEQQANTGARPLVATSEQTEARLMDQVESSTAEKLLPSHHTHDTKLA